jgi:hypothetical protein
MNALARIFGRCATGDQGEGRTLYVPSLSPPPRQARHDLVQPLPAVLVSIRRSLVHSDGLPDTPLRLGKRALRAAQMLAEAREWANELTLMEMRDPAEPLEEVWQRLEVKTGVPYGAFWSLRWRGSLKDIWGSIHSLLKDARDAEHARRRRIEQHEADIAAITRRSGET